MLAVHSPSSPRHDPDSYFQRGHFVEHPEQARRYALLRQALEIHGHDLAEATDHGLQPLLAVHDYDYIDLLATAWSRRREIPGAGHELVSGHFARPQMNRRPENLAGRLGYHMADTSTPIRDGTWEAVYGSAQAAVTAADGALRLGTAYALCRPPGHHAFRDSAGGFCFLNNAAIAAERLVRATGGPVAILDLDAHHGNGTQGIFWTRGDVLTVSVHADPADAFPYYAGYADEIGGGEGWGCNRNIALPEGAGDEAWLAAVADGVEAVRAFRPAALVLALGLGAAVEDPSRLLRVTSRGFVGASAMAARLAVPTVLVQEGGNLCEALPRNLVDVLRAFELGRAPALSA